MCVLDLKNAFDIKITSYKKINRLFMNKLKFEFIYLMAGYLFVFLNKEQV